MVCTTLSLGLVFNIKVCQFCLSEPSQKESEYSISRKCLLSCVYIGKLSFLWFTTKLFFQQRVSLTFPKRLLPSVPCTCNIYNTANIAVNTVSHSLLTTCTARKCGISHYFGLLQRFTWFATNKVTRITVNRLTLNTKLLNELLNTEILNAGKCKLIPKDFKLGLLAKSLS